MQIREISKSEYELWDGFVKNHPFGSFLQSSGWALFKAQFGWQPILVGIFEDSALLGGISLLFKKIPYTDRTIGYAPGGPILDWAKELSVSFPSAGRLFRLLISKVNAICDQQRTIFWRPELLLPQTSFDTHILTMNGFVKSFEELQPRHTLWLDLKPDEQEILQQMKEKGRYNINLAAKKGVVVVQSNDIETFYRLHQESAKRDKFKTHNFAYFKTLHKMLIDRGLGTLFIGFLDGQPLSAMMVVYFGKYAINIYSGSSSTHREVMANYAVQWETIRFAKKVGCATYDFHGLAPAEKQHHHLARLRQYKTRFGGQEISLVGPYDYIYSSLYYSLYKFSRRYLGML